MRVGDLLYVPGGRGFHHFYQVRGVHLAGEKTVGLIEIMPLTEKPGTDGAKRYETMFVPEPMVRHFATYTQVRAPETVGALA